MRRIGVLPPDEAGARARAAVAKWDAEKRRAEARQRPAPEAPKAAEKQVVPTEKLDGPAEGEDMDSQFIITVRTCDLELVKKTLAEKKPRQEILEEAIGVATELAKALRAEAASNVLWATSSSSATPLNEMERCERQAEECDKIVAELRKYKATV